MSSEALFEALRAFGWSLFTELGVPGVVRHHQQVALDPEPIIVAAPALFVLDPRLRDQVYGWCASHAGRLSISRLQGLSRALPAPARTEFHRLSATLRAHAKVSWPDGGESPWVRPPEVKARRLPLERPALLRFRVRGLSGVGARADVLCELIARSQAWTRASDLADEGYSKRAVAGILSELAEARLVRQVAEGNALTFQISHPEQLQDLLGAHDLGYPAWRHIMAAVVLFLDLASIEHASEATRRVEANHRREALRRLADRLWLDAPPVTRGDPAAWDALMSWATAAAVDLANGTSPALGVMKVRAAVAEGGGEVWVWLHRSAVDHERLAAVLREPHRMVEGMASGVVSPTADGWTSFQLVIEGRVDEGVVRERVERLVGPMKVAWRRVGLG
jgi:hypothetical protein